ncbi:YheC/YheD family protein [Longirhabdus pacifica]|uniref:YheC/YheD family protein n=1 Tax=Longirhabdus pacifica TaxID=2305227 RepID=UPI001008E767|nr:YheC/YheD family protein [Longirhabdus pacifica]
MGSKRKRKPVKLRSDSSTLLGIFVNQKHIERLLNQVEYTIPYLKGLMDANKVTQHTIYFFSIKDMHLSEKKIRGTYYNEKEKTWKKKSFPLPNVVYDRYITSQTDRRKVLSIRQQLKKAEVKFFNPTAILYKWKEQKLLEKNPLVKPYLPRTTFMAFNKKVKLKKTLIQMFAHSPSLYMKGDHSSRGAQVVYMNKISKHAYVYSYNNTKLVAGKTKTIDDMIKALTPLLQNKNVVIQHAIDVIKIKKQRIDFRAELIRGYDGSVHIMGISARIGRVRSPITIKSTTMPFGAFMSKYTSLNEEQIQQLRQKIEKTLIQIHKTLEADLGRIGEVGIDFALDKKYKPWHIESNIRTLRVSFLKTFESHRTQQYFVHLLQYVEDLHRGSPVVQRKNRRQIIKNKRKKNNAHHVSDNVR